MAVRKLVLQDIQNINLFEKITKVRPSDCFSYGSFLVFIVSSNELSKAIGPNGANAKKLSGILNRKIKIISYSGNKEEFVKSILAPIKFKELKFENSILTIKAGPQSKALIIGKNSVRLKELKNILERYFKIENIKVS